MFNVTWLWCSHAVGAVLCVRLVFGAMVDDGNRLGGKEDSEGKEKKPSKKYKSSSL